MRGLKDIFIGALKIPVGIMIAPAHHAKWSMDEEGRSRAREESENLLSEAFRQIEKGFKALFTKEGWTMIEPSIKPNPNGKFFDI